MRSLSIIDEETIAINYKHFGRYVLCLFDKEDYDLLSQYVFKIDTHGYVQCRKLNTKDKWIMVHRLIMNCPDDKEVDHVFGTKHDNRKSQLRICTHLQNQRNKSTKKKYLGVYKNNFAVFGSISNYYAQIKINGKNKHVANCNTEIEAAIAYNKAALQYYGEFANLNIIENK